MAHEDAIVALRTTTYKVGTKTLLCVTTHSDSVALHHATSPHESFTLSFPKGVKEHIAVLEKLLSALKGEPHKCPKCHQVLP